MLRKKLEERRVAQILFEIGALVQILGIDLRHRQAMPAKMPGEFEEGHVLFAHVVQNADGADFRARQADDLAPRPAELPLHRLYPLDRRVEVLLEKFF